MQSWLLHPNIPSQEMQFQKIKCFWTSKDREESDILIRNTGLPQCYLWKNTIPQSQNRVKSEAVHKQVSKNVPFKPIYQ